MQSDVRAAAERRTPAFALARLRSYDQATCPGTPVAATCGGGARRGFAGARGPRRTHCSCSGCECAGTAKTCWAQVAACCRRRPGPARARPVAVVATLSGSWQNEHAADRPQAVVTQNVDPPPEPSTGSRAVSPEPGTGSRTVSPVPSTDSHAVSPVSGNTAQSSNVTHAHAKGAQGPTWAQPKKPQALVHDEARRAAGRRHEKGKHGR